MEGSRKNISIRNIIITVFILAMLVFVGSIGYLIFTNWFSSARQTTESIARDLNESIYHQIHSFMQVPRHIHEVNYPFFENGILDLHDDERRDRLFVGVLDSHDDRIYGFSYGTADGEYYEARRNESGAIEIVRNNAKTGGNSWYYSVNEDMTTGDLAVKAGRFDARTGAWYQAAAKAGTPVFSPVYKHLIMDDLAISFAWPVYRKSGELLGVLGTHMLLTDLGGYLKEAVSKYNGYAVILETGTNTLIANSVGADNFTVLPDGILKRHGMAQIEEYDFREAYETFITRRDPQFLYEGRDRNLYINVKEIHLEGLNWIVVTAIPEDLLIAPVVQSIHLTVLLTAMALLLSLAVYAIITRRLMKPMNELLQVSEAISSGDLTKRVNIVRNDEIGRISESFNKVTDKMQYLINNLETVVKERTEEVHKTNLKLEENKNQLQLILDSTAEAIYGVDLKGKCTFCNMSCIKMLGYHSQEDLLGKNMHEQIHHTRRDGTPLPIHECRILLSIKSGKGIGADDEVFWRADGTSFEVEYHSYPQIKNGEVVGAVITFMDITDRKQREAEIQYLSCYDTLTGLYNRRCFEEFRKKVDIPENLPLSIIFADINGLKMTNDIFGHASGDELIKKCAEILRRACRENDIVARVGGDEFIVLLPNTNEKNAEVVMSRIKSELSNASVSEIKCSISLGFDTKKSPDQKLAEVMADAENAMYKDKIMNRKAINKDIVDTIVNALHAKSEREKQHSIVTSELCGELGSALHLSESDIDKLKRAGYLHDIGKITLDESLFVEGASLEEDLEKMQQHPVVGYRILNLFDETLDLAEYVYCHHERWDGLGYPKGLAGEQIPLIARVISIVETFERVLNRENYAKAIETIKEGAGKKFDPAIAKLFVQMMEKKKRVSEMINFSSSLS